MTTLQHILESIRPKHPDLKDFVTSITSKTRIIPACSSSQRGRASSLKNPCKWRLRICAIASPSCSRAIVTAMRARKCSPDFKTKNAHYWVISTKASDRKTSCSGRYSSATSSNRRSCRSSKANRCRSRTSTNSLRRGKSTIETAKQWNETYQQLKEEFIEVAKRGMKLSQDFQHELDGIEKQNASLIVTSVIDTRRTAFPVPAVKIYLDEVEDYILSHLVIFKRDSRKAPARGGTAGVSRRSPPRRR